MLKLKNTAMILTGMLALSVVTPIVASAAPDTLIEAQEMKQVTPDAETFSAITDIAKFINMDGDHYVLDPAAKDVVSEKVFNNYARAVDTVNQQLKKGTFQVENGQLSVNPNYRTYSPNLYGNWYWWGYAVTLSNAETKRQVDILQETQDDSQFILTIIAAIPGLQGTTLPSAVLEGGLKLLISRLKSNNKGKGVTLNLHVGYYDVTSN